MGLPRLGLKSQLKRRYAAAGWLIIAGLITWLFSLSVSYAAQLTDRSINLSSAQPSAVASHAFQFTFASTSNVGSIVFQYCDNSPLLSEPCTLPPGLDLAAASLAIQSGNVGFSISGGCAPGCNQIILTRPAGPTAAVASTYTFGNVTNPSTPNHTTYVRITTYASTDGSGPYTDNGSVALVTTGGYSVGAFVPPFLQICVGVSVAVNCSSTAGDSVDLGILTPKAASGGQSQFAAGTNSITGYIVYILGPTMTSGNNVVPALSTQTPSFPGTPQFGVNLRANSNPAVGEEPAGPGSATTAPGYDLSNFFKYQPGDILVTDSIPSDFNRLTVSYVVNINSAQPPGIYNSTFTYLATAQF